MLAHKQVTEEYGSGHYKVLGIQYNLLGKERLCRNSTKLSFPAE
jgi:hypothetical protein